MRKNFIVNPEPNTHHFYYDTPFSPESFYIYNIISKHALDGSLNTSRVNHFVSKLSTTFPFLPKRVLNRIDKTLNNLHYGWCSHAMELLRGDLNYIKAKREKEVPDDHLIADLGIGIEKLLDSFEIAIRLDEISAKPLAYGANLRGKREQHENCTLGETFCCHLTALVHPESGLAMSPKLNGEGKATSGARSASIFHHIFPPSDDSATWQLFFDMLARSLDGAGFMMQENIETYNGHIESSHLPDMFRVLHYIADGEGKLLYTELQKKSILYRQSTYSCGSVTKVVASSSKQADVDDNIRDRKTVKYIEIDMANFEKRPFKSSDEEYLKSLSDCCGGWVTCLKELITHESPYTRSIVMEFIDILAQFPIPFQYITLHYLVADSLSFSIDRVHRSDYLEWIVEVFECVRFFCGLATVSREEFGEMLSVQNRYTTPDDSSTIIPANKPDIETTDRIPHQFPPSIIKNILSRGVTPGGTPFPPTSISDSNSIENGLLRNWGEFGAAKDRMRNSLKTEHQTGIWSAFQWQFRYHHLSSAIMRWRWCSHVKRPGRINSSRYMQIDRELTYLASCGQSATFDGAVVAASSSDTAYISGVRDETKINCPATGTSGGASAGTSSKSKKKKKKANPDNLPQKFTLLTPNDDPLQFLKPEFSPDCFLPTKYSHDGNRGLAAELERLVQSAQKQCADPYVITELFSKLLYFPKSMRYAFLMHMIKSPFPDHPYTLINLWSGIPMPKQKEDRGSFISMILDMITALSELGLIWKSVVYKPDLCNENDNDKFQGGDKSKAGDRDTAKNGNKKVKASDVVLENDTGSRASNSIPVCFHVTNTSPDIVSMPRVMVATLRQYKDLIPYKIRLENGLSWGNLNLNTAQQKWVQGWWNVCHAFITGCRTLKMLAEACSTEMAYAGGTSIDPSVPLSTVHNATSSALQCGATFKCLLEQLRMFSGSSKSGDDPAALNSSVLQSCAPYGSHVLLERTSSFKMPPGLADTDTHCSDDEEEVERVGKKFPGSFQVKTKVLPAVSSLAYGMDCELAEVFEDLSWAEVSESAKLHCVQLFADYLYRSWVTSPVVLDFLNNNELQALPLVLQYTVLQQLSFASSRGQQECIIHIIRHAYCTSGLLDLEKDPFSNDVVEKAATSPSTANSTATSRAKTDVECNNGRLGATSNAADKLLTVESNNIFGESSLLSMLGDDSFLDFRDEGEGLDMGAKVVMQECSLSQKEQSRLAALTYESFLMIKIRYQELLTFNRWKFGHDDAVHSASMNSLKEEIENVISAIKPLMNDLKVGATKCFEPNEDEIEREGGGCDIYDNISDNISDDDCDDDDIFAKARQELLDEYETLAKGIPESEANGNDESLPYANDESRDRRLIKRHNTRTIIWLSNYSHSDNATSHMLHRMWSSAKK